MMAFIDQDLQNLNDFSGEQDDTIVQSSNRYISKFPH